MAKTSSVMRNLKRIGLATRRKKSREALREIIRTQPHQI